MPEIVFRIAGLLLFIPYVQIRKYWRKRISAHLREKPTIERKPVRERWLLGITALLTVPMFLWFLSPWMDFANVAAVPYWARIAGGIAAALGTWYFWRTHVALAENWSPLLEVREGNTLVTSGPYRFVRHPMYSAALVIHAGIGLLSANWAVAAGAVLSIAIICVVRLRDEERLMIDAFGDEYVAYMARTGRLAPKLSVLLGRK